MVYKDFDIGNSDVFGDRLRKVLIYRGITQKELAERLGTKPQVVNGWIRKRRFPNLYSFSRICNILEIDPKYFLFGIWCELKK